MTAQLIDEITNPEALDRLPAESPTGNVPGATEFEFQHLGRIREDAERRAAPPETEAEAPAEDTATSPGLLKLDPDSMQAPSDVIDTNPGSEFKLTFKSPLMKPTAVEFNLDGSIRGAGFEAEIFNYHASGVESLTTAVFNRAVEKFRKSGAAQKAIKLRDELAAQQTAADDARAEAAKLRQEKANTVANLDSDALGKLREKIKQCENRAADAELEVQELVEPAETAMREARYELQRLIRSTHSDISTKAEESKQSQLAKIAKAIRNLLPPLLVADAVFAKAGSPPQPEAFWELAGLAD